GPDPRRAALRHGHEGTAEGGAAWRAPGPRARQAEVGLHLRPGRAIQEGSRVARSRAPDARTASPHGHLQPAVRPAGARGETPPAAALALLPALADDRRRAVERDLPRVPIVDPTHRPRRPGRHGRRNVRIMKATSDATVADVKEFWEAHVNNEY